MSENPIQGWQRNAVYIDKLSSITDRTPPESAKAAHVIDYSITPSHTREERQHKTGDRKPRPQIQRKRSHEWKLNSYLEPSGSAGTESRMGPVLEGILGQKDDDSDATGPILATPAPTATSFAVDADGSGAQNVDKFAPGTIVKIVIAAGANAGTYYRAVASVTSDTDPVITITPALPEAPAANDVVTGGINYRPGDTIPTLAVSADLEDGMEFSNGSIANTGNVSYTGSGDLTIEASGPAREAGYTYTDQVGTGGIDDTATTLPIKNDVNNFCIGSYIKIEDEVLLVTAIDSDNDQLTVVRAQAGTSAASHAADTAINPYVPSPSIVGEPLAGSLGSDVAIKLGDTSFSPTVTSLKVDVNNNASLITDEVGSGDTAARYIQARAEYTETLGMKLSPSIIPLINQHSGQVHRVELLNWIGNTAGKTVVFYAPEAEMQLVGISSEGDEDIAFDQNFRLLPSTDSNKPSAAVIISFF